MSYSVNRATVLGRLGADPEVRSVSTGKRVATLSVATTESWKNRDGEKQERTEWHRVVIWNRREEGGLADIVEQYARKGDQIYIEGRIRYRKWEDKEGVTKYTTEIEADNVVLLGGKSNGDRVPAAATTGAARQGEAGNKNFENFPEALDSEDDDLPF